MRTDYKQLNLLLSNIIYAAQVTKKTGRYGYTVGTAFEPKQKKGRFKYPPFQRSHHQTVGLVAQW